MEEIQVGDFLLVRFIYDAPQGKKINKFFYARVLQISCEGLNCKFLRQYRNSDWYTYPNVDDIKMIKTCDIERKIPVTEVNITKRGYHKFT